ncbi:MAG: serine hydrolase [Flavobacteriales bacterium]|nr:serine hydrolase [Flavobacteriales bacterium]
MKKTTNFLLSWMAPAFIAIPMFAGEGNATASQQIEPGNKLPPFLCCEDAWADSVMAALSPDERIGQLFMVAAYSNLTASHEEKIMALVKDSHIGGLIFMQGGPVRQARLTNAYQKAARVPLMIAMDAEWGLAMRLDSTVRYPRQMTLGALTEEKWIERMGSDIGEQMNRLGVHVSFSPVVDVNNNPANPVIGSRSFGEDKRNVSRKGIAYMKGLQSRNILANAKHFPGHGDTDKDSHVSLPVVKHSRERLNLVELYPFKQLVDSGVGSIMVAHLNVPALDSTKNLATTLSHNVVTDLLKKEMNFHGLIFTDALSMKGVSAYHGPGEVDLMALLAGNDVLLFSEDVPKAIVAIKDAIAKGKITQEDVDERCKRILMFKHWAGLDKYKPVRLEGLTNDLNANRYELANARIAEEAVTLVKNQSDLLPLLRPDTLKVAAVAIGGKSGSKHEDNAFIDVLRMYNEVEPFYISANPDREEVSRLLTQLESYNLVIIGVHNPSYSPSSNFGIKANAVKLITKIAEEHTTVLSLFASPYALEKLPELMSANAVIVSYEDLHWLRKMTAEAIWGAIPFKGRIPVSISDTYKVGHGIQTRSLERLRYSVPEGSGMNQNLLRQIDTIANRGIREGAYPGCQVLAARDGTIFYYKAFGYHAYDRKRAVRTDDLYDLASITKIAATTAAFMHLVDEGKVSVDDSLGKHLSFPAGCNKSPLIIRDVLTHQAGLVAWIPFWKETMNGREPSREFYRSVASPSFPHRVCKGLYIREDYPDTMIRRIDNTPIVNPGTYLYSDLGYYYMMKIIEKYARMPLDQYVDSVFYRPMGLTRMTYKPFLKFSDDRIPPTEDDVLFRKQLINAEVHDPGAAMMGGVCGHAGLFSDAFALASMMQMFLQKGEYGGKRYINKTTIEEFTRCQYCVNQNRRGIGFDKPEVRPGKGGSSCKCASYLSFGHSGFTGTLAWADPDNGLVYIFLSNRVCPDAENKKIMSMDIRTDIQEVLYNAMQSQPVNQVVENDEG